MSVSPSTRVEACGLFVSCLLPVINHVALQQVPLLPTEQFL